MATRLTMDEARVDETAPGRGLSQDGRLDITIVRKTFAGSQGRFSALHDISLTIGPGEFVAIVGGSGCGKTTLLRILAGLELDYEGSVRLDGRRIVGPDSNRGVVFQEHRLLPWLTVHDNVGFGLSRLSPAERTRKVQHYLELVGLKSFEREYPHQLSGGMAQRVAIARALAGCPDVLLLDEPFASLDALTRIRMQEELLRVWHAERTTVVLVTHDIEEAVYLADRVLVMSSPPGTIQNIVPIDLSRPRERTDHQFSRIRKAVLGQLFTPTPDHQ
jgi:sulfonate transport system ATP-binding protein